MWVNPTSLTEASEVQAVSFVKFRWPRGTVSAEGCRFVSLSKDNRFCFEDTSSVKAGIDAEAHNNSCQSHQIKNGRLFTITSSSNPSNSSPQVPVVCAGTYEGGLSVWECAVDLICYLAQTTELLSGSECGDKTGPKKLQWNDSRVLELGCGHGLPGITSLLLGAPYVTFHDMNAEVLTDKVMYNVKYNLAKMSSQLSTTNKADGRELRLESLQDRIGESLTSPPISYISGSWGEIAKAFSSPACSGYDVVLSSEGVYREELYGDVISLLHVVLNKTGAALFATKRFYFGSGLKGGTYSFVKAINESATKKAGGNDKGERLVSEVRFGLKAKVVMSFADTVSSIRDVIEVRWLQQ